MDSLEGALAEQLASCKLPADTCAALGLDSQPQFIRWPRLRKLIHRTNGNLLVWLSEFNRINLLGQPPSDIHPHQLPLRKKIDLILRDRTRTSSKRWPWIVLALYLLLVLYLIAYTTLNYIYDVNVAKLQKLQQHLSDAAERERLVHEVKLDVDKCARELKQKIEAAREILDLVGRPFIEWSFVLESLNVLLLQTVNWLIFFSVRNQFNKWTLMALKALVDLEDETRSWASLTLVQMDRFAMQSRQLAESSLLQLRRDLVWTLSRELQMQGTSDGERQLRKRINRTLELGARRGRLQHELVMRQLRRVALEGRLNPLNRTPASRDKLALLSLVNIFSWYFYTQLVLLLVYYHMHSYYSARGKAPHLTKLQDISVAFVILVVVELGSVSGCFLCTIYAITVFDQLETLKYLGALIMEVIQRNEPKVVRMIDSSNLAADDEAEQTGEQLTQSIGPDLITVVVQCRLCLKAFAMAQGVVQQVASFMATFAVLLPVVFLVHGSYMPSELRQVIFWGCIAASFCCFGYLAPLGLLHKRRVGTFALIWSLVRQLSYLETVPTINKRLRLGSNVSLFILRGLLVDVREQLEIMAIKVFSLPVTYANLLLLFTYIVVFIMAGGFMTLHLFGDSLASIMSDPFRLYRFLRLKQ